MNGCLWIKAPERHARVDSLLKAEGIDQIAFHFIERELEFHQPFKHGVVCVDLTELSVRVIITLLEIVHPQIDTVLILILRVLNINEFDLRQYVLDILFLLFGWALFLT